MPRAREVANPRGPIPTRSSGRPALLNGAARPMIFVGRRRSGCERAGARAGGASRRAGGRRLDGPRGVMDDRSQLSLSLTMAHRLWPEVDVALAVGSRFQRVQTDWGLDDARQGDPDRPRPGRDHPPCPSRGGAAGRRRPRRSTRCCRWSGARIAEPGASAPPRPRKRCRAVPPRAGAAGGVPGCDPRGAARGRHPGRGPDPGRLRRAHRVCGARAAPVHHERLPGHARARLCERARRQGRAARARRGRARRRRRLHVQRPGARDRGPARHQRRGDRVQRRRLRQRQAHAARVLRQPRDRERPHQSRLRAPRRQLRRVRPQGPPIPTACGTRSSRRWRRTRRP